MTESTQTQPKDEGPRSFARFIEQVDDGQAVADISAEMHKLCLKLSKICENQQKAKAKMTLGITFEMLQNGDVNVDYDVKLSEPKQVRNSSRMYVTKGGNLTVVPQKQMSLGFPREVPKPNQETKDIDAERTAHDV